MRDEYALIEKQRPRGRPPSGVERYRSETALQLAKAELRREIERGRREIEEGDRLRALRRCA